EDPTLSIGERKDRRQPVREPGAVRPAKVTVVVHPLPEGEGRPSSVAVLRRVEGEGEGNPRSTQPVRIGPEVRSPPDGPYGFEPFIISSLRLCRRSLTCTFYHAETPRSKIQAPAKHELSRSKNRKSP